MRLERPAVVIREAPWPQDAVALSAVRRRVFIEEQAVPEDLEWDGEDAAARHWLALVDDVPVGTVRLRQGGHICRMAVLREHRQSGIRSQVLSAAIAAARREGRVYVHLHAQLHARAS